jgi:hypothetical protein
VVEEGIGRCIGRERDAYCGRRSVAGEGCYKDVRDGHLGCSAEEGLCRATVPRDDEDVKSPKGQRPVANPLSWPLQSCRQVC